MWEEFLLPPFLSKLFFEAQPSFVQLPCSDANSFIPFSSYHLRLSILFAFNFSHSPEFELFWDIFYPQHPWGLFFSFFTIARLRERKFKLIGFLISEISSIFRSLYRAQSTSNISKLFSIKLLWKQSVLWSISSSHLFSELLAILSCFLSKLRGNEELS